MMMGKPTHGAISKQAKRLALSCLFAWLGVFSQVTLAQQNPLEAKELESPIYMNLTAGAVMVGGSLSLNNTLQQPGNKEFNGHAQYGFQLAMQSGYLFTDHFGVGIWMAQSTAMADVTSFNKVVTAGFERRFGDDYALQGLSTPAWNYVAVSLMVGPVFRKAKGKWDTYIQPMAGFAELSSPEVISTGEALIKSSGSVLSYEERYAPKFSSGFALGASAGIRYQATKEFGLMISANLIQNSTMQTSGNWKAELFEPAVGTTPRQIVVQRTQDLSATVGSRFFSVNAGITIGF